MVEGEYYSMTDEEFEYIQDRNGTKDSHNNASDSKHRLLGNSFC